MDKLINYTGGSIILIMILIILLIVIQIVMFVSIYRNDLKNVDKLLKRKIIWFFTFFIEMALFSGGLIGYYIAVWLLI